MVAKSSSKKSAAKKSGAKGASKAASKRGNVKITPSSVVFTLNEAQKRQAKKCLAETGRITMRFKEVGVTRLGGLANAEVIVN
jgi:hypothetical protein